MSDWDPLFVAVVLFILLTPGLLFQKEFEIRAAQFVLFLRKKDGRLGARGDSSGAVCAVKSRIAIPVAGEEKSC
ncbi:hypothetical protein SADUNF_Sadunf01G0044300 [Salix dunnii]|uniref:Uncharacterized protein n=1 Tax=Salix dunnii TaxID=1413687 RepID=A0A835TIZ5_9ROSI|nr:hypothetical protein SADUNF_Sadunf01G0044300 [Salix dunnii]